MAVKKEILFRAGLIYVFFLLFGIAIISRILYIQIVIGDKLRAKSKDISLQSRPVFANRGDILSSDGRILATSIPSFEIRIDTRANGLTKELFRKNIDSVAYCLAKVFKDKTASMYKSGLTKAYREGDRDYLIKRRVGFEDMKLVKQFPMFREGRNKSGLKIVQENLRFNPNFSLALRTIGYVSKGSQKIGIEGSFDETLRGVDGNRLMQRLSGGIWIPVNDDDETEPMDGSDVISTIDIGIQDVAECELRKVLEQHNANAGCAVVMEVETGEVKAIVNLGKDKSNRYSEIYNYALLLSSEPGSTFKLASIIAALEDGYIRPTDTVDTRDGSIKFYGRKLSDSGGKGHGRITIQHAFELSSNVGISYIINKYYEKNPEQFVNRLYAMGLNTPLELDIKGISAPEIKHPGQKGKNGWTGISLPWMSIGYEVRMTPIQMLTFYNAIANNGKMIEPRFVKSIMHHGKIVRKFEPEVIQSSVCSRSTLKAVRKMLEGVVDTGTAKNLKNPVFKIAGKTGTSRISNDASGYTANHQASFVGYFPADNPKYSCIVVVYEPSNGAYYGNVVAGPVFREIAKKVYATCLDIHPVLSMGERKPDLPLSKTGLKPNLDYIYDKLDVDIENDDEVKSNWVSTKKDNDQVKYNGRKVIENLVPNVVDMGLRDALYLLENAGLRVVVKGRGKVVYQSISPGIRIKPGDLIYLELKMG